MARILAIHAHPDDVEILAGGTLGLLADAGHRLTIATFTPGDCGSHELGPEELADLRRREAAAAAAHIGANDAIPHLYFMDPVGGCDREENLVRPDFVVNVAVVFERKRAMLAEHASQRSWLRKHHGTDEYLLQMEQWTRERGALAGVSYGEGFRQYRAYPYPRTPLLQELLTGAAIGLR